VTAAPGNLAQCLAGSGAPACFNATRESRTAIVAGAVAPGAPSSLAATSSGSSVTLSWSAPTSGDPVQSYFIEAGTASGLANLANVSTGNAATLFSASGVGNGTYYVRVRASNSAGISSPSNEAILIVGASGCTTAPGAPGNLFASATNGTVTLTWTAASGTPTSYVIEAGSASGLSNLANSDLGGTPLTYRATNVGNGTYYIRLRAKNACGLGTASNEFRLVVSTTTSTSSVTVTSVSPTSGSTAGGTLISISGTGFKSGATATFGGAAATVTAVSTVSITAFTPAHAAGAVDVVVTNTDGTAGTRAAAFTYTASTSSNNWQGTTGQSLPMSFSRGTSTITSFTVAYTISSCGLSGTLTVTTTVSVSASGSFSYDGGTPFGGGSSLAINGTLTGTTGSGSLTVRSSAIPGIGGCNGTVTTPWNATGI
jgi:hypothetical protein